MAGRRRRSECDKALTYNAYESNAESRKKSTQKRTNLDIEGMLRVASSERIYMQHRKQTREYGNRNESNRIKISLLQSMTI